MINSPPPRTTIGPWAFFEMLARKKMRSERKQGFFVDPFYGRARFWPMLASIKT